MWTSDIHIWRNNVIQYDISDDVAHDDMRMMRSMLSSMWWILMPIRLLKFVMIPTWWIMLIHSRVIQTKSLMIICSRPSSCACEIDNEWWYRFHYEYNAYEHRNVLWYGSLNTLDSFMMVIRLKLNMWGSTWKWKAACSINADCIWISYNHWQQQQHWIIGFSYIIIAIMNDAIVLRNIINISFEYGVQYGRVIKHEWRSSFVPDVLNAIIEYNPVSLSEFIWTWHYACRCYPCIKQPWDIWFIDMELRLIWIWFHVYIPHIVPLNVPPAMRSMKALRILNMVIRGNMRLNTWKQRLKPMHAINGMKTYFGLHEYNKNRHIKKTYDFHTDSSNVKTLYFDAVHRAEYSGLRGRRF